MPLPLTNENNTTYRFKIILDWFFSIIVCIFILSWFIPFIAILIKLGSKGPIFFIQKRSGLNGLEFSCIKLRSMYLNASADTKQASLNDSRITWIGKFLRKFSLDELPQFINVLMGQMSIIGPRPHMVYHTQEYGAQIEDYHLRLSVKPGITGLSQVLGYRGEIQNQQMIQNRVRLDLFYIKKQSFYLDGWIALKTIRLMVIGS